MRFGCGAIFGVIVGLGSFVVATMTVGQAIAVLAISGVVCGLFAALCGDDFWRVAVWPFASRH